MKELKNKPIIEAHYPIKRLPTKRWVIAQSRPNKLQVMQNDCIEAAYHRIINHVKKLYMKPGDTYYERDLKTDKAEGSLGMHSFMSSTFYWMLYCEFTYQFSVEFAFCNCPFETEVREMLKTYPLDRQATEKELQPNYKSFYEAVQRVQDAKYFHAL
jgi:hypothetical protein